MRDGNVLLNVLGRYYRRGLPIVDEERITQAWQQFHRTRKEKQRKQIFIRCTWAAVVAFFFVLTSWFGIQALGIYEREKRVMSIPVIAEGYHQARLSVSDGTKIDLIPEKSGQVIIDRGVNVAQHGKSLAYHERQALSDTFYHTLEVPHGGEFQLTLSDGSRVWLNSESQLIYPVIFDKSERRVYLVGEAYFEVEPGKGRFVVETGNMDVRVLGTAFNVNAYKNETTIRTTLVHGKVEVLSVDNSICQILVPGEQAVLDIKNGQLKVEQVNTDFYTRWMKGQFVFRDTPLRDIMRTLARWYEMDYEFIDPELETLCFYGMINRFEKVESLLKQFEKTGKVHFKYQGNKIIIEK